MFIGISAFYVTLSAQAVQHSVPQICGILFCRCGFSSFNWVGNSKTNPTLFSLIPPKFRVVTDLVVSIGHIPARGMAEPELHQTIRASCNVAQIRIAIAPESVKTALWNARGFQGGMKFPA